MKIESLTIGRKVRHPNYGVGIVRSINPKTAEIEFDEGVHSVAPEISGIEPADPEVAITGLNQPLSSLVGDIIDATIRELGLDKPDSVVAELGRKWHDGRFVMHPADPALQTKEVPMETFFHKIVMIRNNLRVLEQKINSNEKLNDGEKVELQQYITRSYGSLTSFNLLFREKEDQFRTG